jgi:ATP-dependent protease ClpP protease subunit
MELLIKTKMTMTMTTKKLMNPVAKGMGMTPPERSWYQINASATDEPVDVMIYDEIGNWGITAHQFASDLTDKASRSSLIRVHLHSLGGDVFEGLAIYNMLKNHPATIEVYIGGIAASMGSVIAMAGDTIYIPENAWIMVHKPWGIQGGNADDMRQYADLLDQFETSLVGAYTNKTGLSHEKISELLTAETWLMGKDAVELGFADQLTDAVEISASLPSKRTEDFLKMPAIAKQLIKPKGQITPEVSEQPTQPQATELPAQPQGGAAPYQQSATDAQAEFRQQEQQRRTDIRAVFNGFDVHGDIMASCLDDMNITVDEAKNRLLTALGKSSQPASGGHQTHINVGNGNIVRDGMVDALSARAGVAQLADSSNHYRGMTLLEMARMSLTERGVSAYGMDRMDMIAMAFTHTSSDFGNILSDVARKSLLRGYDEAEETFHKWTQKGHLSDFKPSKRVGFDSFPELKHVPDGGQYTYATLNDTGETIQLATYGKMFGITRQTIINDDLDAFSKIPSKMGRAAVRTVGNLVYSVLMSSPKMSDGIPLFDAKHKNLLDAAQISVAALDAARTQMALQVDSTGSVLNISPSYLLVPVALRGQADLMMNSMYDPHGQTSTTPNIVQNLAEVISDARIDKAVKNGALPWFLTAGSAFDTIEVAYLDGNDKPHLEQKDGWTTDGAEFKVRLDAGVSPMSYRTMMKNPGKK